MRRFHTLRVMDGATGLVAGDVMEECEDSGYLVKSSSNLSSSFMAL